MSSSGHVLQDRWCTYAEVRSGLGWETDYERGFEGQVQDFERGLVSRTDTGEVYLLYSDDTWDRW